MIPFTERAEYKKGMIGEVIVDAHLRAKGFIPYFPSFDGAHPFDRLVARADGERLIIVEVKSKQCRDNYPDTGIDIRHYQKYRRISQRYKIHVFLAFVDDVEKKIYGATLAHLKKPRENIKNSPWSYPDQFKGIVYFPRECMKTIAKLSDDQCITLRDLRTSNHISQ